MRSLLGVLMVLAVSANDCVTKHSAGESVLLPCNCTDINRSEDFHWQMESDGHVVKVIDQSDAYGRYKGRAEIFLNDRENSNNCSLLLRYLNANDTGIYRCSFYEGERYQHTSINLNVSDFVNHNEDGIATQPLVGATPNVFKIIPIVLLLGFCLVCGAILRE